MPVATRASSITAAKRKASSAGAGHAEHTGIYAAASAGYWQDGYGPMPMLADRKHRGQLYTKGPPPKGWTGHDGKWVTLAQVERWRKQYGSRNIGLRLPRGVIGIDLDWWKGEEAQAAYNDLVARLGPLPLAPRLTSRDDGVSGIRLFGVPEDFVARERVLGAAGEVIQYHHRFAVAPPSIHPDTGQPYRCEDMPWCPVDGLGMLCASWLGYLPGDSITPGAMSEAEVRQVALCGVPAGCSQSVTFCRLTWAMRGLGMGRDDAVAVWDEAVAHTLQAVPWWPWTHADFDGLWASAGYKQESQKTGGSSKLPGMFDARNAVDYISQRSLIENPESRSVGVAIGVLRYLSEWTYYSGKRYGHVPYERCGIDVISSRTGNKRDAVINALSWLGKSGIISKKRHERGRSHGYDDRIELVYLQYMQHKQSGKGYQYIGPVLQ